MWKMAVFGWDVNRFFRCGPLDNRGVFDQRGCFQMLLSKKAVSWDLDKAPTLVASTLPSLNNMSVGIPRIPYLGGVSSLASSVLARMRFSVILQSKLLKISSDRLSFVTHQPNLLSPSDQALRIQTIEATLNRTNRRRSPNNERH